MNIIISGVNGFIGHSLAKHLHEKGHRVFGVSLHTAPKEVMDSLVRFDQVNLRDSDFNLNFDDIDVVIHLAARVHVTKEKEIDPINSYMTINNWATARLARLARDAGVKKFIFLSSLAVNGTNSGDEPFTELSTPKPDTDYGRSKWKAEQSIHRVCADSKMKYTIIRPPLVFGPGAPAHFAILLRLIRSNFPLPLARFSCRRSFMYVDNLCDFISNNLMSKQTDDQTFLIADTPSLTIPELVKFLSLGLAHKTRLFPIPMSLLRSLAFLIGKYPLLRRLSLPCEIESKKVRQLTGWTAPHSVKDSLAATVGNKSL